MKKLLLLFSLFLMLGALKAQDNIVLKKGGLVKAKILEITNTDVRYKNYDNLEGPTITKAKTEISRIRYQDGRVVSFEAPAAQAPAAPPVVTPPVPEPQKAIEPPQKTKEQILKEEMEEKARLQRLEDEARKEEELKKVKKAEEEAAMRKRLEQEILQERAAKEKADQDRATKAKDDLERKTYGMEKESTRDNKDFPGEIELYGGSGMHTLQTNQFDALQSLDPASNTWVDAYKGSDPMLSTSFGLQFRFRLVGAWYWNIGAGYNEYQTETSLKLTTPSDPNYLKRFYLNKLSTIGIPLGTTIYFGNRNRGKLFIEGGMLTHIKMFETDEVYNVVYGSQAESAADEFSAGIHLNPYAGLGFRFRLSNRTRLNITSTYLFKSITNISTANGVEKTLDGVGMKVGFAVGLGQTPQ